MSIIGQLKKKENADLSSSMEQDEIALSMGSQSHEVMQTEIAEEDETDEQLNEKRETEAKKEVFKTPEVLCSFKICSTRIKNYTMFTFYLETS